MNEDEYQIENIVYDRFCIVCGKTVRFEETSIHLKSGGRDDLDLLPFVL
jgi:hypothetical protein